MQKKYKCFLFDLDGTLLDTAPEFLTSLNVLLKKNKLPLVNDSFVRKRVSDGVGKLIQDSFHIDEKHIDFESTRDSLLDEYNKNFLLSKSFSGVDTVLKNLSEKKIDWMIVTNKPKRFSLEICNKLKWDKYAKAIISPEDANGRRKPDPASLEKALSETSTEKDLSVYVGDNWRDIEAAKNAGIDSVLAMYGYLEEKDASLLNPTSRIGSISELQNFF